MKTKKRVFALLLTAMMVFAMSGMGFTADNTADGERYESITPLREQTSPEALIAALAALAALPVSNDTTQADIMAAVEGAITNPNLQAWWATSGIIFDLTPATRSTPGHIMGTIHLGFAPPTVDDVVIVNIPIPTFTPPIITTYNAPNGTIGDSYEFQFLATGSPVPTWHIVSGDLPSGLYLSGAGLLSGTPTTLGTFTFEVQATNILGTSWRTGTIEINFATGAAVNAPTVVGTPTTDSITVEATFAGANMGGQTIEFAVNTTSTTPTIGWQSSGTFAGLTPYTQYYFFARAAHNATHATGTASAGTAIRTYCQHDMSSTWTVRTAPTCTADGVEYRVCTICNGNEETRAIAALGHDLTGGAQTVIRHATCTVNGAVRTNCVRYAECGHYQINPTATYGHDMGAWSVTTSPTCTTAGVETRNCQVSGCDHVETRSIPALGHDFGAWTVTTAPTITTAGVETRTCTRCNTTETRAVAALSPNTYAVTQHFGTWSGTGTASATVNAPHANFVRLLLNGTAVAPANFTVTAGSTVITLNAAFLDTLNDGDYTFVAEFTTGVSQNINLTVTTAEIQPPASSPQTGVNSMFVWIALSIAAASGIAVILTNSKKISV